MLSSYVSLSFREHRHLWKQAKLTETRPNTLRSSSFKTTVCCTWGKRLGCARFYLLVKVHLKSEYIPFHPQKRTACKADHILPSALLPGQCTKQPLSASGAITAGPACPMCGGEPAVSIWSLSYYKQKSYHTTRMLTLSLLLKTSQELRMLSSVTLNCQVTKIVMDSVSQL